MSDSNSSSGGGVGIAGIFLIIFVCAKIFGWQPIADWSWWWVTSPAWIPLVIALSAIAIFLAGNGIVLAFGLVMEKWQYRKRGSK